MSISVEIRPWPSYQDDGAGPFWHLRVEAPSFHGWVEWAAHLGRFVVNRELHRLRANNAAAFHAARAQAANFCAANQLQRGIPS